MNPNVRPPTNFGNHEANAELRYVEVYAVSANEPKAITGATNASPIVITSAAHGFTTGDRVTISGVLGNTAANGTWTVTVVDGSHFSLDGQSGNGAYTSGGNAKLAQPVQVRLLRWTPAVSDFVPYGTPFRVGDANTEASSGERLWVVWRNDIAAWMPIESISQHFQVIRGATIAPVIATDLFFQIGSIVEFEELAKLPTSPVWVACQLGTTLGYGDLVWAVYHKNYATFILNEGEEDEEEVTVDWVMLPTAAGSSTPPLRFFEYLEDKAPGDNEAEAIFLDDDLEPIGDPVTLHDPYQMFYGRAADYIQSGVRAFRGLALQAMDLGGVGPDRWVIVASEGYAETCQIRFEDSPVNDWVMTDYWGDGWETRPPVGNGERLTIHDPLDYIPLGNENVPVGAKFIVKFKQPMSAGNNHTPTYALEAPDRLGDIHSLAVVVSSPTSANGGIGSCWKIADNFDTIPGGSGAYRNIDKIAHPVGARIILLHTRSLDETDLPWGHLVAGFEAESFTCQSIEVVTSVACVDDEVVGNTTTLTYVSCTPVEE